MTISLVAICIAIAIAGCVLETGLLVRMYWIQRRIKWLDQQIAAIGSERR